MVIVKCICNGDPRPEFVAKCMTECCRLTYRHRDYFKTLIVSLNVIVG